MQDSILLFFSFIGAVSTILAIFLGIRTLSKHPFIFFELFKKSEITLFNETEEEKIALLSAPIGNLKKTLFGDTAKKISVNLLYQALSESGRVQTYSNEIPWLNTYPTRFEIEGSLKTQKDIQKALENNFFHRQNRDIFQGRGEHLAVAYGIEKTNKMFLATKPPIEICLPKNKRLGAKMHCCIIALEIAGENIPSTTSKSTYIFASNWINFSVPEKIITIQTPSKLKNFLLRLGVGREIKILGSDKA